MGDAISCLEHVAMKYLTPPKAALENLPPAPSNSLLLIGEVQLAVPNMQEARQFFLKALGAEQVQDQADKIVMKIGPSRFALRQCSGNQEAKPWPGHFYMWVADIQWAWSECQELEKKLGKSLIQDSKIGSDGSIEALILQDPFHMNWFSVNQAPKALLEQGLHNLGRAKTSMDQETGNAVALVEVTCLVPTGRAAGIAKFYSHFLNAAVSEEDGSCKVYFSPGETLTQSLRFEEDEEVSSQNGQAQHDGSTPQLCIYMPSAAKFQDAMAKSKTHQEEQATAVTTNNEFKLTGCFEVNSNSNNADRIFALKHVIRSPSHQECPIEEQVADADSGSPSASASAVISKAELSKHKQKTDIWIAVNGSVYDVTKWLKVHPGGQPILMSKGGTDVTDEWNMIHKPGTIERMLDKPFGPKLKGRFVE